LSCCLAIASIFNVKKGNFMKIIIQVLASVVAVAVLSACATSSPDIVSRHDAQVAAQVQDGVVISIRQVTVDGSQTGMGAAAGGVVGAMIGSGASAIQREKIGLGVLAGVAGAVAGNAIERMATKEEAFEIIVQMRNGDRRAVVQAKGSDTILAGDSVIIVTTGGKVRVARAPR
jgi:outer membrane lipoprotein SlyB